MRAHLALQPRRFLAALEMAKWRAHAVDFEANASRVCLFDEQREEKSRDAGELSRWSR